MLSFVKKTLSVTVLFSMGGRLGACTAFFLIDLAVDNGLGGNSLKLLRRISIGVKISTP